MPEDGVRKSYVNDLWDNMLFKIGAATIGIAGVVYIVKHFVNEGLINIPESNPFSALLSQDVAGTSATGGSQTVASNQFNPMTFIQKDIRDITKKDFMPPKNGRYLKPSMDVSEQDPANEDTYNAMKDRFRDWAHYEGLEQGGKRYANPHEAEGFETESHDQYEDIRGTGRRNRRGRAQAMDIDADSEIESGDPIEVLLTSAGLAYSQEMPVWRTDTESFGVGRAYGNQVVDTESAGWSLYSDYQRPEMSELDFGGPN